MLFSKANMHSVDLGVDVEPNWIAFKLSWNLISTSVMVSLSTFFEMGMKLLVLPDS